MFTKNKSSSSSGRIKAKELDLYDAIMPLYYLSKVLGLAPFSLKGKRGKRKFVADVGAFVFIRIVSVLSAMVYVGYLMEKTHLSFDIGGVAMRVELYLGTVLTPVVLLLAITNQNLVILAIKCIIQIDRKMKSSAINITYKNARKFCIIQIIFIIHIFSLKGIIQVFSSSSIFIGVFSVFNLVDFVNTIMLFQYTNLLLLLRQRYIWLNREISIFHKMNEECKILYPNEFKVRKKVQVLKFIGQNGNSYYDDAVNPEFIFQNIAQIHNDLYDAAGIINRAYSIQLLLTVGVRFLMVTSQLLNTYDMITNGDKDSMITFILAGIFITLHTLKLFMFASISSNTADKAKQTAIRLHKIWDRTEEMKQNIQHFSLQILQQDLNFTAGGFFILNYELMYNMLGALTTYLIILIQFDTARQDPMNHCANGTLNRTGTRKETDN